MAEISSLNVYEEKLQPCCFEPLTGWYRDGYCNTDASDQGVHSVCILITEEFLNYSKSVGNDLSTATPWFPGLKEGDKWCLCAERWQEAFEAGMAPPVFIDGTHITTLEYVQFEDLEAHSIFKVSQ
jgi:uncharacterized protein